MQVSASLGNRERPAEDTPSLGTFANQAAELCGRELGKDFRGRVWGSELLETQRG